MRLAVLSLVLPYAASQAAGQITVGYGDYRPLMSQRNDGTPGGFSFDVLSEAARREGVTLTWKFVESASPDDALASGAVDLWPAAADSPERRKELYVSSVWWRNELQLLTKRELRFRNLSDLTGKRIASVRGLRRFSNVPGAVWISSPSHNGATESMCLGRAEATLLDRMRLDRILLKRPVGCRDTDFRVVPLPGQALGLSILARRESQAVAENLRRRIDELTEDGTLAKIALRHPPVSSTSAEQIAEALVAREERRLMQFGLIGAGILLVVSVYAIYRLRRILASRQRAERQQAESESRFRTLVEATPQLVWSTRSDGSCDYLSRQWIDYTGRPQEEHLGDGWLHALHPEDRERVSSAFASVVATGDAYEVEYRLLRHDGQYRWFQARGLPLRDSADNVVRWLGTSTDIHDRKENEDRLRVRNEHLQQFAWAVSHDLQEPLRMVMIFSQLLQRRFSCALGPDGAQFLRHTMDGAQRVESMLHALRDYWALERPDTDRARPVPLDEALWEAERNLGTPIDVRCDELPAVLADRAGVHALLQNLLSNAAKYRHPDREPMVHVTAGIVEGMCMVRVRDNGIGIPPEYREQVFEIFRRLHGRAQYAGNGIRLALCRRIVERHGGRIWVESEPGGGSTFCFTLPVSPDAVGASAA